MRVCDDTGKAMHPSPLAPRSEKVVVMSSECGGGKIDSIQDLRRTTATCQAARPRCPCAEKQKKEKATKTFDEALRRFENRTSQVSQAEVPSHCRDGIHLMFGVASIWTRDIERSTGPFCCRLTPCSTGRVELSCQVRSYPNQSRFSQ